VCIIVGHFFSFSQNETINDENVASLHRWQSVIFFFSTLLGIFEKSHQKEISSFFGGK
jgi:hypothetical protein